MSQGAKRFLRLPSVKARTGLSRSELYRRVQAGAFPQPIKVGARAVAWIESDIDAWMASCIERSRTNYSEKADKTVASNQGDP